jgi:hypothetical protein
MEDVDPIVGKNILGFCGPTSTEAFRRFYEK